MKNNKQPDLILSFRRSLHHKNQHDKDVTKINLDSVNSDENYYR
jgi:hypothetical protein